MSPAKRRSAVAMMMVAGGLLAAAPAVSGCAAICKAMGKGPCSAAAAKCGPAKCSPK